MTHASHAIQALSNSADEVSRSAERGAASSPQGGAAQQIILARLSDRVTVEEWAGQTYWRWVVAEELAPGHSCRFRRIRAYSTKSNAMRAGRALAKVEG